MFPERRVPLGRVSPVPECDRTDAPICLRDFHLPHVFHGLSGRRVELKRREPPLGVCPVCVLESFAPASVKQLLMALQRGGCSGHRRHTTRQGNADGGDGDFVAGVLHNEDDFVEALGVRSEEHRDVLQVGRGHEQRRVETALVFFDDVGVDCERVVRVVGHHTK